MTVGRFQLDTGGQTLLAGTGCAAFYSDAAHTTQVTGLITAGTYYTANGDTRLVFNQLDGATVHDYRHVFIDDVDLIVVKPRPSGDQASADLSRPRWNDLRVGLSTSRVAGAGVPGFAVLRDGVYGFAFDKASTESVYFEVQLPHDWVEGTGIRPHVHWSPGVSADTGDVRWELEYSWSNPVNAPGNVFPTTVADQVDQTAAGAYAHQIAQFTEVAGTGMRVSSVLVCRLSRVGGATEDTFDADAYGLSFDFHIQVSGSHGSDAEYPS